MQYLVDTNILIDYWRNAPDVADALETLEREAHGGLAVSIITVAESFSGTSTRDANTRDIIETVLKRMTILDITYDIAVRAGEIRRDHDIDIPDALIAATAIAHNCTLVTRNTKHFQYVPDLRVQGIT